MQHAKDIDLIELTAGRLDPAQAGAVSAHVDACPDCRRKLAELRRTWDVLGTWRVEVPDGLNLTKTPMQPRVIRMPAMKAILRVAASIALATVLGYVGGSWTKRPAQAAPPAGAPAYLSVLGSQGEDGLSSLILSDTGGS
jgi:anti-sigma factor RsiW